MSTAIFYGSNTGNSEDVAKQISQALGGLDCFDLASCDIDQLTHYDKLILGLSTWGEGDLQDDWDDQYEAFKALDLSNKTIALFGLGDQEGYAEEFVDALGTLYEHLKEQAVQIIGFTSIEGYNYEASKAQINDEFCGLVIDEDNQHELTEDRINNWIKRIKDEIL